MPSRIHQTRHRPGIYGAPTASTPREESFAREEITVCAHRGPCREPAVPRTKQVEQLLGPPLQVIAPRAAEKLRDGVGDAMRAVMQERLRSVRAWQPPYSTRCSQLYPALRVTP